jgi:hypothetical protein
MGILMGTINKITLPLVTLVMFFSHSVLAGPTERNQAKRIHDRLTGISVSNIDPDGAGPFKSPLDEMEDRLIADPSGKTAAEFAIDTTQNPDAYAFYNVTLKNFAAPWTNEAQTVFTSLNDYSATVIGAIRDGLDFRRILWDDLLYVGNTGATGIDPYRNDDNDHYEQLEALDPNPNALNSGNLADPSILTQTTQSAVTGLAAPAGIMTSRAGAMAFFSDGTNRAMFRFTLMNHLCTDLEPLKDTTRPPDHVRRDVSRSPGGDSRIFLNGCVGCHAGMDGMAGAFAFYEWNYNTDITDGNLVYDNSQPSAKHNINPTNFEYGYEVIDDHWVNYWRNGPNAKLGNRPGDNTSGWGSYPGEILDSKGNAIGTGASSLGRELANSKAFAQCQVDKVFKAVCLRDPNVFSADRLERDSIVSSFTSGYNMREVFTDVAAHCKGS